MPFINKRILEIHRNHRRNVKKLYGGPVTRKTKNKSDFLTIYIMFVITIMVIGVTLNRINVYMALQTIHKEGINYDYFRELIIPTDSKYLGEYKNTEGTQYDMYDNIVLDILLKQNGYSGAYNILPSNKNKLLDNLSTNSAFKELKGYIHAILDDVKTFPVNSKLLENEKVTYIDSWNYLRNYGGKRKHEGTDIMSSDNQPDVIRVLSMTDGTVEKLGWLEMGGYRVGIRGTEGAYFYYAHLSSYAEDLKIGDKVMAGDFIGYMGDSGYGIEGTTGKFPVHLHVGIYIETPFGEVSVNPYLVLKILEASHK